MLGLVGDDAPAQTGALEGVDHGPDLGEYRGHAQQPAAVDVQEPCSQGLVARVAGAHPEGCADHATRATAHERAQDGVIQRRQAVLGAQVVGSASQIRGAVDEGAVQVEQHGLQTGAHRASSHRPSSVGDSRNCGAEVMRASAMPGGS